MNITGEQVRAAYDSAPAPIRQTFSSDDTTRIIIDLQSRHKLHVDSTGVLGKQVGYLLLGLITPMEFLGGLVEAGVSAEAAKDIVSEVNERIFIPLRAKMQGVQPTTRPGQSSTPAPSSVPVFGAPPVIASAPLLPTPSLHSTSPQSTQVITTTGGWPGAPAGNWQPAAAVHVYVPGPAPHHTQPPAPTAVAPEHQAYVPAPVEIRATTTQPPVPVAPPEPVAHISRPVPQPPANLPGAPVEKPIEKAYVADPYREPM